MLSMEDDTSLNSHDHLPLESLHNPDGVLQVYTWEGNQYTFDNLHAVAKNVSWNTFFFPIKCQSLIIVPL